MITQSKGKSDKDKLQQIKQGKGQILLTYTMIEWTKSVDDALQQLDISPSSGNLKKLKAVYKKRLSNLIELIEKPSLSSVDRKKINVLIIMEEHNREVIYRLADDKTVTNKHHFNWQSQLRYYRDETGEAERMNIRIEQLNASFDYGFEYQGNNGRLVVTQLTDRAYMTLTNALNMMRGGAPQGPAGTGKTETVKDLGKNLAFYVVIQNCAPEMEPNGLGDTFQGLAMSGSWGCFDEFNRILLDVLSVITTFIDSIFQALKAGGQGGCTINDKSFKVNKNCGLFITMNPGYAGRQELPDNLQALFRPVAMMVPDFQMIAKNELMAEGFQWSESLAQKIYTIYQLMKNQLSKQFHYDYGMRAIKSVLRHSGLLKQKFPNYEEVQILIKAIRDMNLPRFLAEDVILFDNLFMDLFSGFEEPEIDMDDLQIQIEQAMIRRGLVLNENLVVKCMQLYESKCTRHGNMLIGFTHSGKTTTWELLQEALNKLYQKELEERQKNGQRVDEKEKPFKYKKVSMQLINPKSVSLSELYGCNITDGANNQWKEGVLSKVLKEMCESQGFDNRWMILDGPVDTLWIETMNSVLDDSKLLTLTNGDRIKIPPEVRLLFEVQDLSVASPATVSRAGMIYLDIEELPWKHSIIESWINSKGDGKKDQKERTDLQLRLMECVNTYLEKVMTMKKASCKELVPTSESACIKSFCNLFDLLTANIKFDPKDPKDDRESYLNYIEKWFVFAIIWSVGVTVESESREFIDSVIREISSFIPLDGTVFDYLINTERKEFQKWAEKIPKDEIKLLHNKRFHEIQVQTVDGVRNRFLVQTLLENPKTQVLLIGHSGVGKTTLIESLLRGIDPSQMSFTLNFSAGTTSNGVQDQIESNFIRGAKDRFKPKNSKTKAICFIDDLNMPRQEKEGGCQPPLELLRQFITCGFWYDRTTIKKNEILNLQVISSMGMPGGGRAQISQRLLSRFHVVNYTVLDKDSRMKIYKTIADITFLKFEEDIKALTELLALSTIDLFDSISKDFKPTPSKSHYVFNMRDISKVFEGLFRADKDRINSKDTVVKLWSHEVLRVFYDRLIDGTDQTKLKKYLNDQIEINFQLNYEEHCTTAIGKSEERQDACFVDFLDGSADQKAYTEVKDFDKLREYLNVKLEEYNSQPRIAKMDIVLFKDALVHISKIYRVINFNRGHCLLVGVGGSGRHSLTKLSAFISEMASDQLLIRSDFSLKDFRLKFQDMYKRAAFEKGAGKKTVFIFSDNDVVDEAFLEDIQNQLNGGIIPNIFSNEDLNKIKDEKAFKTAMKNDGVVTDNSDAQTEWLYRRIKDNMHISMCMSPIGERFRNYTRMFPALINNTTIDWFMPWPLEALQEVANKFINAIEMKDASLRPKLSSMAAYLHYTSQMQAEEMKKSLRRIFYVTPTNFVELLKGYEKILKSKSNDIGFQITKLTKGLEKLNNANTEVSEMTDAAKIKQEESNEASKQMSELMEKLQEATKTCDREQNSISAKKQTTAIEAEEVEQIKNEAEEQLRQAQPACDAARQAVEGLDSKSITEVKSYTQPPKEVARVMGAVMTYLGEGTEWSQIKKTMGDSQFMKRIIDFDMENIKKSTMEAISKYTSKEDFTVANMTKKSAMAGVLCGWVRAVEEYFKAYQIVKPKKEKVAKAEAELNEKMALIAQLEAKLAELLKQKESLAQQFEQAKKSFDENQRELEKLKNKIDRGERLISGLSEEKIRWEKSLENYHLEFFELTGDSILAAAYMSYCGPFPAFYRQQMHKEWMREIAKLALPHKKKFTFISFQTTEDVIQQWTSFKLPTDDFSKENGIFINQGLRWALNIDPQSQANLWIKNMYSSSLKIADPKEKKYLEKIREAVIQGHTILLQDIVGETLDPSLDNVLNKTITKTANARKETYTVKFGADEITYDMNFRLFMTTRMPNPHYTPEVSTKVAVINFTVVEAGLEEQCLGIVVQTESPQSEESRIIQVKLIADNNRELKALEDKILDRLNNSQQNLLEDTELMNTLNSSKEKSAEVKQTLEQAENVMKRINDAREVYKPCAKKAAILFFVLNDLNKINPMYQFSLDKYKELFQKSIVEKEQAGNSQDTATVKIEKVHTLRVYRETCKSLFERHKLLLALSMCVKLQMAEGKIAEADYDFFLRGGGGMGDQGGPKEPKPALDWIKQTTWDQLLDLQKNPGTAWAAGIAQAVSYGQKEWRHWYQSTNPEPEEAQLPGEWLQKCEDPVKKMIILRCFRPDRVNFAIRNFVKQRMNSDEFIQSRPTSIAEIVGDSNPFQPVLFVLTQGTDPTAALQSLQKQNGIEKLLMVSLGKGQGKKAAGLLEESCEKGFWVFLSNCHLSVNLLPELESIMDDLYKKNAKKMHPNFRIFLSAVPTDDFPISLLQRALKLTQEPPRGIKMNMTRLYKNMDKEFIDCDQDQKFRKAVYGLCWFHTILIERKKFKTLGWNSEYSFNDSDYKVCEDTLAQYFGRKTEDGGFPEGSNYDPKRPIAWTAIQQLIAQANYGGRVTDDCDRRLITTYAKEIFDDHLVTPEKWRPKGTEGLNYSYPIDEVNIKAGAEGGGLFNPEYFIQLIEANMEKTDMPAAYGQHTNAEINSQITESLTLLDSILSLQPAKAAAGGKTMEEKVLEFLRNLKMPEALVVKDLKWKFRTSDDPLITVLVQEVQRYNVLLETMVISIEELIAGIMGEKVITDRLDTMMRDINANKVPQEWSNAYFSLKPLASWFEDLCKRYDFFTSWVKAQPHVFMIGYFTFPTGFTTGLLQKFSRKGTSSPAIDLLGFDYIPKTEGYEDLREIPAKDGAYIQGLYLEGANWNRTFHYLTEPNVMELEVEMPIIHFKPVQKKKDKIATNVYSCPTYYYPIRKGVTGRDSYMFNIELKLENNPDKTADHWVKRGTALLMSLKD